MYKIHKIRRAGITSAEAMSIRRYSLPSIFPVSKRIGRLKSRKLSLEDIKLAEEGIKDWES